MALLKILFSHPILRLVYVSRSLICSIRKVIVDVISFRYFLHISYSFLKKVHQQNLLASSNEDMEFWIFKIDMHTVKSEIPVCSCSLWLSINCSVVEQATS